MRVYLSNIGLSQTKSGFVEKTPVWCCCAWKQSVLSVNNSLYFASGNSRMFSCTGEETTRLQFANGGNYTAALREGSFEMFGDRVTKLGTNM